MPDERTDETTGAVEGGGQPDLSSGSEPHITEGTPEPRPRAGAGDGGTDGDRGAIPFSDHERVVNGFHERLDRLSWAAGYDPREVQEAFADAREFRRLQTTRRPEAEPQPDVEDERGERFYSPQQAARLARHLVAEAVEELRAENETRFTPLERTVAESRRADVLSAQIEEGTTWPGFNENIDPITDVIAAANRQGRRMSLHQAYIQAVVIPKLAPSRETLETELRRKILAEMDQNVQHSDVNPRRAPSGNRKADKDKSWKELLSEEWNRQAAASR